MADNPAEPAPITTISGLDCEKEIFGNNPQIYFNDNIEDPRDLIEDLRSALKYIK